MLTHQSPKPENPSRVLVLGGGGFLGRAVRAALDGAGISSAAPLRPELDLTADDASDRVAAMLQPSDAVLILAAVTPDKGRGLGPFMQNLKMAAIMCAAMQKVRPAHVVYVSSDAVYPADPARITEETCAQPPDLYGMMHLAREVMLKTEVQAPLAVLRPTLIFGAADPHNSYGPNRLRRMAQKDGRITLFGEGEEMRDHISIDDVAALIRLTLRHRSVGTLNVATGRAISYADLARKVAALFATPVEVVGTPRRNPVTHRHFDVVALHKAFPSFTFAPLDTGLAKAHREMLEQA
jgi:UDP-glucose 4-epimerase